MRAGRGAQVATPRPRARKVVRATTEDLAPRPWGRYGARVSPARLLLVALLLAACDDPAESPPALELYIDGTRAGEAPTIAFPEAVAEGDGVAAQLELKNLGPADLVLTSSPPLLLERDDRLAFRVTQPPKTRYARGESLVFSVVFAPHSPGASVARLLVTTAHETFTIALTGTGVGAASPALSATIDGAAVAAGFDFGSVRAAQRKEVGLKLANSGTGSLTLPAGALALSGADAAAFDVGPLESTAVPAGADVVVPLGFTPDGCRSYRATLTVRAAGELVIPLSGRGGDNPQGHADVSDTELLDAPDLDVALSSPTVGGKRRFVVGNLTVGSYSGQVGVYTWDGCALSAASKISASNAGLDASLFGAQVALSDDGGTLLVTARDQRKDAWLFDVDVDGVPHFLATLATFDEGGGHGRGAALAGDGSAAFIGQAMADNGFNSHGAVFAYERPTTGWQNTPEARFRLVPAKPNEVELIGSWVDASDNGDVVISGALLTPVGAPSKGPATVFVWEAVRDADNLRSWGRAVPLGEPNERTETVRLTSAQVASDAAARVAIAADGNTIALSAVVNNEVQIRLYARSGPGDLWGKPTVSADERLPTATLSLAASPALRMALGPDGAVLLLADAAGAREVRRPGGGWLDAAPIDGYAATWNVPFYGGIAVAPDGAAFAGMDKAGSAWFVFR